ncbi:hypothetical protein PsYK624_155370 [Phanerochaete sordida]|uniref:BTB domain-containing protein n=1 Tax=Phanerochaete sordida TaxID=48140 RepID=A0A9P3GS01_9APHY|nr:hypothetical protein PsYK624_155370 [Phanerochaete sordida]
MDRILRPPRQRPPPPRTQDAGELQTIVRDVRLSSPANAIVKTSDNTRINVLQSILATASPVLRCLIEDEQGASLEPTTILAFELECGSDAFIYVLSCSDTSIDCPVSQPLTDGCLWEFWKVADDLQVAPAVLALKRELYQKAARLPFKYYILSWRHIFKDAIKATLPFLFVDTSDEADHTKWFDLCDDSLHCKPEELNLAMIWWKKAANTIWDIVYEDRSDVLIPWLSIQHATSRFATGQCAHNTDSSPRVQVRGKDNATFFVSERFETCLRRIQSKLRKFPSPTTVIMSKKMILDNAKAHCSEPGCLEEVEVEVERCLEELAEHVLECLETQVDVGLDAMLTNLNIDNLPPYGVLYTPMPRRPLTE